MDLAELHLHLDGSLRMATVRELAERARMTVPERLLFHPGMGLAEALSKCWAFSASIAHAHRLGLAGQKRE